MEDLREEVKDGLLKKIKETMDDDDKRRWAVLAFHDLVSALRIEVETTTKRQLKRNNED